MHENEKEKRKANSFLSLTYDKWHCFPSSVVNWLLSSRTITYLSLLHAIISLSLLHAIISLILLHDLSHFQSRNRASKRPNNSDQKDKKLKRQK